MLCDKIILLNGVLGQVANGFRNSITWNGWYRFNLIAQRADPPMTIFGPQTIFHTHQLFRDDHARHVSLKYLNVSQLIRPNYVHITSIYSVAFCKGSPDIFDSWFSYCLTLAQAEKVHQSRYFYPLRFNFWRSLWESMISLAVAMPSAWLAQHCIIGPELRKSLLKEKSLLIQNGSK